MATTKKKAPAAKKPAAAKKAETKKNEMRMVCGTDVGNSWCKQKFSFVKNGKLGDPSSIDFPSAIAYVPTGYKWVPATPSEEYMDDLANKLDCDVKTPIIPEMDKRRMLVGERAAALSNSLVQFSVEDRIPKSDTPLAYQLILSGIAAAAVREYFDENEELPEESLQVEVDLGLALPFTDYVENKEQYESKLVDHRHTVNVHNFDIEVTVHITVRSVAVLAEGQAGIYALTELSDEFLDTALSLINDDFGDEGIDTETLRDYSNIIAIDLGGKTTDIPLFLNGELEPAGSMSLPNKGFGNVIENMMEAIRNTPYAVSSRNELENILLNDDPTPAQRAVQKRLLDLETFEADSLARDVTEAYKRVLGPVKMNIEAVYVFGGGATRMKDALYDRLRDASEVAPGIYLPVIWLSEWSRLLNRNGLYMLAKMAYEDGE